MLGGPPIGLGAPRAPGPVRALGDAQNKTPATRLFHVSGDTQNKMPPRPFFLGGAHMMTPDLPNLTSGCLPTPIPVGGPDVLTAASYYSSTVQRTGHLAESKDRKP